MISSMSHGHLTASINFADVIKLGVAEVQERRGRWLSEYLRENDLAELCAQTKISGAFVEKLVAGRRSFTDGLTELVEARLGLKPGTVDGFCIS